MAYNTRRGGQPGIMPYNNQSLPYNKPGRGRMNYGSGRPPMPPYMNKGVGRGAPSPIQPAPVPVPAPSVLPNQPHDPSNYTQPAYSTQPGYNTQTQPKPVASQQPPTKTEPAPQQQQQPQQQAPKPQVQQAQAPKPQAQQVQAAKQEMQEDVKPALKDNGPAATLSDQDSHSQEDGSILEGEGVRRPPRPWFKKNLPFNMRVSKKIRKRRQNARLRHLLAPKNAMMVLHELYPELKIVVTEQLNAANQMVYTVDIEIDGKSYRGHGMSKLAAKQAGCETALKAVLLEKMAKSNVKVTTDECDIKTESDVVAPSTEESAAAPQSGPMDTEEGVGDGEKSAPPNRRVFAEDDVPWGSLASFALYKLFSEWQAQGFQLPTTSPNMPPIFQKMTGFHMAPMKRIPEDANKKHPVQLLNQLRPGSQYSETREGTPPNLTFTFTVIVDGTSYQGVGTSKKDAKKECAKAALQAMGVKYD